LLALFEQHQTMCQSLCELVKEGLGRTIHLRWCTECRGSGKKIVGHEETGEIDEAGNKKTRAKKEPCEACQAGKAVPHRIIYPDSENYSDAWKPLMSSIRKLASQNGFAQRYPLVSSALIDGACYKTTLMFRRHWVNTASE
jgi:hypothetical protein